MQQIKKYFSKNPKLKTITIIAGIVLLGAILRFYHLGNNPLLADEFLDMNSSYGYFKTHVWQAWDFNKNSINTTDVYPPRDLRAWVYKWQVAELFRFLPPTEAVARSISVMWGLITIVLMYFVAKSFTKNKTVALLASLLFAISVSGVEFDRKLRMYAMFFPVYLVLSWTLFLFLESRYKGSIQWLKRISDRMEMQPLMIVPVLLLAALSFHLQLLSANIAPVFFVYVLVQCIIAAKHKKGIWNKYYMLMVAMILGIIGIIYFLPGIFGLFFGSLKFFINNSTYLTSVFDDYGLVSLAVLVFVAGIVWLWKTEGKKKEALWLATSFFVPVLMAAFLWKRPQGSQYIFFALSFLMILMAAGIYAIADFFRKNLTKYSQKSFVASIVLLLLLIPNYGYFLSGNDNTYHRGNTKIGDYRKVFTYIKKYVKPGDFMITRNFRSYYLSGEKLDIFDFGGEREISDLSVAQIQDLVTKHPSGWIVLFDNDDQFISNQGIDYIKDNLKQVDVSAIRGKAQAYRWGIN